MTTLPSPDAPVLTFAPELLLAAQGIRLLLLDVDGVLTDASLLYGEDGEILKRFNALDGHGIKLLVRSGIHPVIISGRDSPALRRRLADLGVRYALLGCTNKLGAAETLIAQLGLTWAHVAAMGDDWPDLPLLARAALPCTPPPAHAEALALARHVTRAAAGAGAVREVCDLLLMASGRYALLWHEALGGGAT